MPFIGNQPALAYTSFAKQDFTTSATTSYTLDNPVANENEIALFINFVRQEPTTAYTANGVNLTLTSATSASDDMYCVYLGKAVQTVNPPAGSVGTSQLEDGAVTKAKTTDLLYPAFEAYLSANQTTTNNTAIKVQFNNEVFDTDSMYDNTTNYRFTPTVAGKYYVYANLTMGSTTSSKIEIVYSFIFKNGSTYKYTRNDPLNDYLSVVNVDVDAIVDMNGTTDYLEIYGNVDVSAGTPTFYAGTKSTYFGAYRIGA